MLELGVSMHSSLITADARARRDFLASLEDSGLDQVTVGDHISFHGGTGFDGMVAATSVLAATDRLKVVIGVYQAALRHPMITARQVATLSELAPGRLVLGVGVGGEDRSEAANSGINPATRGRRLDETLGLLRRLATGELVDHEGEFYSLNQASILPAPSPRVPIVIGGGGDAAVRRTVAHGDGWLAMFCTSRRFAETRARILDEASAAGGRVPDWFGFSVWCGIDSDPSRARQMLGDAMHDLYKLPTEKFEHLTPAGTPEQVADWLAPYVAAGARNITLVPIAGAAGDAVDGAAEVRRILQKQFPDA